MRISDWSSDVCSSDLDQDGLLLGFRDLVEARIVHALRKSRIGLPTIRLCIDRAKEMLGEDHPFSTKAFKSDGKRIFIEITKGVEEPRLINLKERQHVFRDFVLHSLQGLEFGMIAPKDGGLSMIAKSLWM